MDVRRNDDDDNLESNLLTSSLLKILVCTSSVELQIVHVEPDVCVEVRDDWIVTAIYTIATIVTTVTDSIGYHSLHGSVMDCSLSHKSRCGRSRV